jgi:hypothetical protein
VAVLGEDTLADSRILPKGALVVYREWYGASGPNKGLGMKNEDIGAGLKDRTRNETIQLKRADPSIFKSEGGPSIAEQIKFGFAPADNSRIAGWSQIRSRLIGEDDKPMLYIFDTCTALIRTLPALQHDTIKPEDLDSDGEDHAADALRYALMARPYSRPAPVNKPIKGLNEISIDDLWKREKRRGRSL